MYSRREINNKKKLYFFPIYKSIKDLKSLLEIVQNLLICIGSRDDGNWSEECLEYVDFNKKLGYVLDAMNYTT